MRALKAKWQDENPASLRTAATNGDVAAQTYLGLQYISSDDLGIQTQGVYWCRLAANQGFALAEDFLGWAYGNGKGVERDYDLAEKWMHRAADQGLVKAEYDLGFLLENEFNSSGQQIANFPKAAEWFQKAADHGSVKAMMELGDIYYYGKLGYDYPKAVNWYSKAAQIGEMQAARNLGELYRDNHEGFPANLAESAHWYRIVAETGDSDAQYQLACLLLQGKKANDPVEAESWLTKASENGNAEAAIKLAALHNKPGESVLSGFSRDALEASVYNHGHEAQLTLGVAYEEGQGGAPNLRRAAGLYSATAGDPGQSKKNRSEALRRLINLFSEGKVKFKKPNYKLDLENVGGEWPDYFEDAPRNQDQLVNLLQSVRDVASADTQFQAGEMFYQGTVLSKDTGQAADWFSKAAALGSAEAMNRIGEMWAGGMNGVPDLKEAANWYRKAAAKGLAEAQYNLGLCYATADGVPANPVEAWKWLQLAAEQHFPNAAEKRDKLQSTMAAEQLKQVRAMTEPTNATGNH